MPDHHGTTISGNHKICASLGNHSCVGSRVEVNMSTDGTWFGRHSGPSQDRNCILSKNVSFFQSVWSGDKQP